MCGELETPFFHRALARPDLSDPLGDTFSVLLQLVSTQGKLASVILPALDVDGTRRQ